ncbi:pilus assembly PilX family protein [Actimicrobium sp. CCI2.3]|uniref:pilus assembly PilX family protein n=1 Tax=Actimicrobium sp. CCI2.3 TaxID=3048616 RepID=UPI002AB5BBE0|nr:PilX N-terminal domain-containing pilus assembly protein [Actimicrobium sp. CCI2.3]MDY7574238.1 PilX N-terminal domain-containing pilus assembly protein [Actimicrobium sp. CCI2.3]MEB0022762.1 PilX N-terminal domain-containing pilus assembly protein [Actimicrobium sp. CCI2.3]
MMIISSKAWRGARCEKGSTLLIGMLFLIILILFGLSAALISKTDERMARNSRDRNIAFFAAESALRDARADIHSSTGRIQGATGATADCSATVTRGLCLPAAAGKSQVWETFLTDSARSVEYGEMTLLTTEQKFQLVPARGGVTAQPRYLIEVLPDKDGVSLSAKIPQKWLYRITAIGFGANAGTSVIVQEIIRP